MAPENSANEYAKSLQEGLHRLKENKAATAGERLLRKDYERIALEKGPDELKAVAEHLKAGVEAANATPGLPRHIYIPDSHQVNAGKFAIVPSPILGLDSYRLDLALGLHPNATQFMDMNLAPPVKPMVWHLCAVADDDGFFWLDVVSNKRINSRELTAAALGYLSTLLLQDAP